MTRVKLFVIQPVERLDVPSNDRLITLRTRMLFPRPSVSPYTTPVHRPCPTPSEDPSLNDLTGVEGSNKTSSMDPEISGPSQGTPCVRSKEVSVEKGCHIRYCKGTRRTRKEYLFVENRTQTPVISEVCPFHSSVRIKDC